jgi:uncharacterized repeat protein (TIGR04042 family)
MRFSIRWPDGSRESCYSPSLVVKDFFVPGATYPLADFVTRARRAFAIASARVEAKYGSPCARAAAQVARIERAAENFATLADARVSVDAFRE